MRFQVESFFCCAALALTACAPRITAAPNTAAATSYTPEGCSYTVTIPPGMEDSFYPATSPLATTPPVHVHASYASDPSTSFAINWSYAVAGGQPSNTMQSCPSGKCTDTTAIMTQVIYGTSQSAVQAASGAGDGVTVQYGHTARYSAIDTNGDTVDARIHEVHVCGLTPATTYYYKVGNPGFFSNVYSLVTAPVKGATTEYRFGIAGDARDVPAVWAQAEQAIKSAGAVFQIFSGDLINLPPNNQYQLNQFFEAVSGNAPASDVMAEIPIMPTSGNHDEMSIPYMEQFAIPQSPANEESAAFGQKEWYSFDYANAHFIALYDSTSTSVISGAETTWLSADLAAVDRKVTPWIFVFHHQPQFTCDSVHAPDTAVLPWQQLFDQYHVDVVFNGHVHNYQRSYPSKGWAPATTEPTASGTVYVVAGAVGIAPDDTYGCLTNCSYTVLCNQTQNYMVADINANTATFTATNLATGAMLDSFTITK